MDEPTFNRFAYLKANFPIGTQLHNTSPRICILTMKLLIFASILVCASALDQAWRDHMKEKLTEFGLECAESEQATSEDIEALHNHKPPVTHAGRCVIFCVSKKLNLMNADGTLNVTPQSDWIEKVKETDSEAFEKMKTVYHHCADTVEVEADACDTSLSYAHCIKEEGHKVGLYTVSAD
uniref:Odorant-binding protein 8 n=1 Tax=Dendroctonus ponderosae TaxID=77166 RepID=M4VRL6_DENPD|nr:odorant-binding protein 8 [Dendroctonus ponderosae]